MRPKIQPARDQLEAVLARHPGASASELAKALNVSVPTLHRMLGEIGERVVSFGKARRARYSLRRNLRGQALLLPVYRVDAAGSAQWVAQLIPLHPQGSSMSLVNSPWPVPQESIDGRWDGLPYPIYDMQPRGYMGRQFAVAEHRELMVSPSPAEWSDDDVLHVLNQRGSDSSGDLILGDPAYERWQSSKVRHADPVGARQIGAAYEALAQHAVAQGVPGSSAAGEFPKFTAARDLPGSLTPHVLVKFSGAERSATVRRWADLLVCEHLALECAVQMPGVRSARSRIVAQGGRTFLEVERFDRHGPFGRSALVSLSTANAALLGDGSSDWPHLAGRFTALNWLSGEDLARIELLWWYGRLIANTDMHLGNLSFRPNGLLELAPAYDMLPMLYAPLAGGEVAERVFEPRLPLPPQREAWNAACAAALTFWRQASQDKRISERFRKQCAINANKLQDAAQHA